MIAIVGAGPAGSQAAYELARAGEQVHIFEEHTLIGQPVACTGLLTKAAHELFIKGEIEDVLVNTLKSADIVAQDSHSLRIPLHEYVVDRTKLDQLLVQKALDHGAELFTHHKFIGKKGAMLLFNHDGNIIKKEADNIVGADGPLSEVAKAAGIFGNRKFYFGFQATVQGEFDKDVFTAWFGDIAPGFFAWSVPETATTSRVGLATTGKTREYFEAFMKKLGGTITDRQAGPIPIYKPSLQAEETSQRVFLVGDAAGLNKSTTGGGIIVGMQSGRIAADCILNEKNYELELSPLRRELWLHMIIRRALNRFSANDYGKLVKLMENKKVRNILAEHPREYPSRFIIKLLRAEPGLLRFAPKGMAALVG